MFTLQFHGLQSTCFVPGKVSLTVIEVSRVYFLPTRGLQNRWKTSKEVHKISVCRANVVCAAHRQVCGGRQETQTVTST